ncbi:universal stress protein [Streptomyces sp. NPDC058739]|uniref:universal stress protein n=1 Tax=Streptomyces sp. NPDC058739 TaxID=3346618 RepID=UPI0036A25242
MLRPVVVGLDGSAESLAAADWAAAEALGRGLPLRLLHAGEGLSSRPSHLPELDAPRRRAHAILQVASRQLAEKYPLLHTTAGEVARPPVDALVEAGSEAEFLVLGSRAFSGVGGLLAGSVAMSAVARVPRPVVLVRAARTTEGAPRPAPDGANASGASHPVVVGVDLAHSCEEVVAFAFENAALRSVPLHVVHSRRPTHTHERDTPATGAEATSQSSAERALADLLAPWRERHPKVVVRSEVSRGSPVQLLLHACADADLLVLGRRIRPALLGPHIGRVTHAMIHEVPCPVAVVPHG